MAKTIKFWQEMLKALSINPNDKFLIGKNDSGEAQYCDANQLANYLNLEKAGYIPYTSNPVVSVAYTFVGAGTYGSINVATNKFAVLGWRNGVWNKDNEFDLVVPIVLNSYGDSVISAISQKKATETRDLLNQSINDLNAKISLNTSSILSKESLSNKSQSVDNNNTKYPSNYAVKTYVDNKLNVVTNTTFGGAINDTKDLREVPKNNIWYFASPGTYKTSSGDIVADAEISILAYSKTSGWEIEGIYINISKDFIVYNNVESMRNMSNYEKELIINGLVKGVTLLGYYTKGDTPAPIEYYLSNTSEGDDGGSVIIVGGVKLEHIFIGSLDVSYFGALGDGVMDNSNIFNTISSYTATRKLDLIISKVDTALLINGSIPINSSIYGVGEKIKIRCELPFARLFNLSAPNITIDNLDIEFTNTTTNTNAPIAIEFRNQDNTIITNSRIINGRISCSSTTNTITNNIRIINCEIDCDLTPYDRYQIQNDVFYFIGVRNVLFSTNKVTCLNVNRVFKFADFDDNPNSIVGNIEISNNTFISTTDSTKQFIDCYQHTHNFKFDNNTIETYGHNSVIENKTTMAHMYNRDMILSNNVYRGNGTFARAYGVFASDMGRDIGGVDNIQITNNTLTKTDNDHNLFNFMGYHDINISNNIIKGIDKDSPIFRIGNIKNFNFSQNTWDNGFGIFVADNNIDGATYSPSFEKLVLKDNVISGEVGSAATSLIRVANHPNIKFMSYHSNNINHKDINQFQSRPLILTGTTSVEVLVVKDNQFNGDSVPLQSATVGNYKLYNNSWSGYNYQLPDYTRSIINTNSTLTFQTQSQLFEIIGTSGNTTLSIAPSDKFIIGTLKTFRNSSNFNVTLVGEGGVNIGGTLLLNGNTTYITLICTGLNTYRTVSGSTVATTLIGGTVKQASASTDVATAPSATYTQSEVQAILTELRDLKIKLRSAGILAT